MSLMEEAQSSTSMFLPTPFVWVCDMNGYRILGPSESPQAAARRSQVYLPTQPDIVLSCWLV